MAFRGALVLVLMFTVLVPAARSAAPSPAAGYLSDDYQSVAIASNAFLKGAKVVGRGYPLTFFPKAKPELEVPVWARHCTATAQTVTLTRDLWLPGPPNVDDPQFVFFPVESVGLFGAVKTIDLIVNGKVVIHMRVPYRSKTAITVPLDAVAQKTFRYGENTFQVRAHKHATAHKCNAGKTSQLGVEFVLTGRIATDLVAGITQSAVVYRKLAPNQIYSQGTTSLSGTTALHGFRWARFTWTCAARKCSMSQVRPRPAASRALVHLSPAARRP
jgi:hypothetical protein